MHDTLNDSVVADVAYVTAVRQICALAGVPGRAVGFIEREVSRARVSETLLRERIGDKAYEKQQRDFVRKWEGLI